MQCPFCQSENTDTNNFCGNCGQSVDQRLVDLKPLVEEEVNRVLQSGMLDQKVVEYAVGNPCEAEFKRLDLSDYLRYEPRS